MQEYQRQEIQESKQLHGRYICFVDSDDYVTKTYVEEMIKAMEDNQVDLVICNYYFEKKKQQLEKNSDVKEIKNISVQDFSDYFYDVYTKMLLNQPWNKLYKTEYIKQNFRKDMSLGEDLVFNIDYLTGIKSLAIINEYLYMYDIAVGGNLHKKKQSAEEFFYLYWYIYEQLLQKKYDSLAFQNFIVKHYIRFLAQKEKTERKKGYKALKEFAKKIEGNSFCFSSIHFYTMYVIYFLLKKIKVK